MVWLCNVRTSASRSRMFSDSTYGMRCRLEAIDGITAKCRRHGVRVRLFCVHAFALDLFDGTYGCDAGWRRSVALGLNII